MPVSLEHKIKIIINMYQMLDIPPGNSTTCKSFARCHFATAWGTLPQLLQKLVLRGTSSDTKTPKDLFRNPSHLTFLVLWLRHCLFCRAKTVLLPCKVEMFPSTPLVARDFGLTKLSRFTRDTYYLRWTTIPILNAVNPCISSVTPIMRRHIFFQRRLLR